MNKYTLFTLLIFLINAKINSQNLVQIQSVQSLYIELYKDNRPLGSATGFVIKSNTQNYLITNWHVVTNKRADTKTWIDNNTQIEPNIIKILHNSNNIGTYKVTVELLTDAIGRKTYKEFQINNEMVDVVAIPLTDTITDIKIYPIDYKKNTTPLIIEPTEQVLVLGFPRGVRSYPAFPIWKSGIIASEPDFDRVTKVEIL